MDQIKLRIYDGIAITGFLMLPSLFTTEFSSLAEENKTAGWLALLIGFAIMTVLFLIIAGLIKRHEGSDIIAITAKVMGKPWGILYGLMLGAYFCFYTGVNIRESAEVIKIYGLYFTPPYVVICLMIGAAVIMNFFGGRGIIKTAGFFFIIIITGIISVVLLGLGLYNPDYLVPVLGNGWPDIIRNGLLTTSVFDGVIVLFLLAPAFAGAADLKKAGALSLVCNAAAYVVLFLCYIMMFSPAIAPKMVNGFIEMGKSNYYNHFFYRFESMLLFNLIFSVLIQASIGLFIAKESFALTCKRKPSKTLTALCTIPVIIAAFLPANLLDLTQRYLPITRRYSVFLLVGFPLLVLIVSIIKGVIKHEKN